MEKPAVTDMDLHETIARRWSPLAFSPRAVEPEKLRLLFEAARWAPSSYNEQPWRFIVATSADSATFTRLLDCLVEANQEWARQAPVLAISCATVKFAHNQKANRHAWHDVGMAEANLATQATALGLFVHFMAGFSAEKAREHFQIPTDAEPVTALALGYYGRVEDLSESLRARENAQRSRRDLSEIVFAGQWGKPAAF